MNTEDMRDSLKTKNLNRGLFWITTVTLILAIAFLITGFFLNNAMSISSIDMEMIEKNTVRLADLFAVPGDPSSSGTALLPYLGIMAVIVTPVVGLIYTAGYFIYRKELKFALISIFLLLVVSASLVTGFILK